MQYLVLLVSIIASICSTQSVVLRTSMANRYPQVAVLGCHSLKANLYYDVREQVWKEDTRSSCVHNEENILKFCQQTYPLLQVGNIVRLDTILRFDNWCELSGSTNNQEPRCKTIQQAEESVQPFRCLHPNSAQEDSLASTPDCLQRSLGGSRQCLRAEKWEQLASLDCSNRTMILSSSLNTLEWCGLSEFRGVEFICCPLKDTEASQPDENDYQTRVDEQNSDRLVEDDPISELLILPQSSTVETHRRVLAMSHSSAPGTIADRFSYGPKNDLLASAEPNWMQDYQQWNSDTSTFADDEDVEDGREQSKVPLKRKSHLTVDEHTRFTKEKETFKRTYQQQIEKLRSLWQQRQAEIQALANRNPSEAQTNYEKADLEFRQEYDFLKQTANRERARINKLHENNLDQALDAAKRETNAKLITAWNDQPFKTEQIQEAIYDYLHVLLRDRIHLVNRYERLRVVDPEQGERKRVFIHERLRLIAIQINQTLSQLSQYPELQQKILPSINAIIDEYGEVNQAAKRLLINYEASLRENTRRLPLGRDEKKIYPFPSAVSKDFNDTEYDNKDDDSSDEYDDDDDERNSAGNSDVKSNVRTDSDRSQAGSSSFNPFRPLIPRDPKPTEHTSNRLLTEYLAYLIGCLSLLCLIIGIFVFRRLRDQRRRSSRFGKYEKTGTAPSVDSCTPDEKALRALQTNGYENPTYKFFEKQPLPC